VQIIIHDIYRIGTSIVEFCAKVEVGVQESSDKTRSYISRSNVHWKIEGRWSCGITLCGRTNNVEGWRGGERHWSGNTTIYITVGGNITIHKGVGDGECIMNGNGD
jgi:hypothetical protein